MINKNTIIFFIFLFVVLYYISPNNKSVNNNNSNKHDSKPNNELVCKNIENIENALNDVIGMVKGLCHNNIENKQIHQLKERFDDKLEREILAKKYLKKKLKESFKDVAKVHIPKEEQQSVLPEQNNNFVQYNQSDSSAGFSNYSPEFKNDNILNPY